AREQQIEKQLGDLVKTYPSLIGSAQERKIYDKLAADWKKTHASYQSVAEMVQLGLMDDAIDTFIGENQREHDALAKDIEALIAENDRQASPAFDANDLIGKHVSYFGLSEATVRKAVATLEKDGVAEIEERFGEAVFNQTITMIHDDQGNWSGDVCEWRDRSLEVRVEDEVARIVRAAATGDSERPGSRPPASRA
ncbi:hypothetical protein HH299_06615, partial [Xanthomonas sp. Kuri4-2]